MFSNVHTHSHKPLSCASAVGTSEPLHTTASRSDWIAILWRMSHPRCCEPLRFHTRVLPPLIRMPTWAHNSSYRTVYECKTLSGRLFTTHIVEECHHLVILSRLFTASSAECWPKENRRHEEVSLFFPLLLVYGVCLLIILPQVRTGLAIEHLHERHNRSQHTLARDEVESSHTILIKWWHLGAVPRACTACATHSHPAFVVSACWNGAVAASTVSLICCAIVRAHHPPSLTPPDFFCKNRVGVGGPLLSRGVQTRRRLIVWQRLVLPT